MAGPWEQYQAAPAASAAPTPAGPWTKYGGDTPAPKAMTPVDNAFKAVEGVGSTVLGMPYVSGPLAWVGDKLERYVDAPVRAQIGALQNGKSFGQSIQAGGKQLGSDTLPTTPSGKEIMAKAGVPTTALSEVAPGLFSDTGEGAALKRGGILDVSPAGIAGTLTQPSMFAIPADAILGGASKAAELGGKVVSKAGDLVSPLADAARSGAQLAQKGVFKTGEVLTGGALNAADAIKAADRLTGTQLLLPDAYTKTAGKAVGAARDAIEGSGKALTDAAAVEKLQKVRDIIVAGEEKAMKTPGSQALLDRIDRALEGTKNTGEAGALGPLKKVPVEAVDDMIRDLNTVEYTERGNPRSIEPRWAKPLAQARGELEPLLQSTPEGAALSAAKAPYAALKTAQGSGSALRSIMSMSKGAGGAAVVAAITHNPVLAAATYLASRAIAPRTYFQIVGAAKLPSQALDMLTSAYQTGKASVIGETMTQLAAKYPQEITKIATAVADESANDNAVNRRLIQGGSK